MTRKTPLDQPDRNLIRSRCPFISSLPHRKDPPSDEALRLLVQLYRSFDDDQLVTERLAHVVGDDFTLSERIAAILKTIKFSPIPAAPTCAEIREVSSSCEGCKHRVERPIELGFLSPREMLNPYRTTPLGNGERLIELAGEDLKYTESRGWLRWTGKRWEANESAVVELFKETVIPAIFREASEAALNHNSSGAKELASWAKRSEDGRSVASALYLAKSDPRVYLQRSDAEKLDGNPYLLAVQNGTIDLRTGELLPHRRDDLITRIAPIEYDSDSKCPKWTAFLDRVFSGNQELIGFIQRVVGYALTGDISEQCAFFLVGAGCNGKSVFSDIVMSLLGDDLAAETPADSIMLRKNDTGIPNDIARLAGLRLVAVNETEDMGRLAEARMKGLTGGDKVAARFLHREYFEFRPKFKIFLRSNHRPVITGTDYGIWRRIRLIPFDVQIPQEEQDKHLVEKLKAELPGILRWAVEGAVAWHTAKDLQAPAVVIRECEEYRLSQDVLAGFLSEQCYIQKSAPWAVKTPAKKLYQAYLDWCESAKETPKNQTRFGEAMTERGFRKSRDRNGITYEGIGLLSCVGYEQYEPFSGFPA